MKENASNRPTIVGGSRLHERFSLKGLTALILLGAVCASGAQSPKKGHYKVSVKDSTYDFYIPQEIKGWKLVTVDIKSDTLIATFDYSRSNQKQRIDAVFFPGQSQIAKLKSLISSSARSKAFSYRSKKASMLLDIGGKKTSAHVANGLLITEAYCVNFGGKVLGKTQEDVFKNMSSFAFNLFKSVNCKRIAAKK